MRHALALLAPLLLCPVTAGAGHGLLNAFAGIEWLPPAGLTPESPAYALDYWSERAELRLARSPAGAIDASLRCAREKLAETEVLLAARKPSAAAQAIALYSEYIEYAGSRFAAAPPGEQAALAPLLANALLEHQYIVSTDYRDLPRASRGSVREVIDAATAAYANVATTLPRRVRDAFFFKEEEVRWAWDMALAADAQGL